MRWKGTPVSLAWLLLALSPQSCGATQRPREGDDVSVGQETVSDEHDLATADSSWLAGMDDFPRFETGPFIEGCTGFPAANFSVSGEVTPDGELFSRIMYNPPVLGSWLEEWGRGRLSVVSRGKRWTAKDCRNVYVERSWPLAYVEWSDPGLPVKLRATAWAPVVEGDVGATALPVLVAELVVEGPEGESVALDFDIAREKDFVGVAATETGKDTRLDYWPDFGLGWVGLEQDDRASFKVVDSRTVRARLAVKLPDSGFRTFALMVLFWHPDCRAAAEYTDLPQLFSDLPSRLLDLGAGIAHVLGRLPVTGDAEIDENLHWYMTAGVMLTRVLKDETTLTMGYAELNQRDSFWTSFMHLLFWPEAERVMLWESAEAVRDDGKVPTCILPLIEREDDIDINEYFLLRVARYYRAWGDLVFLEQLFPACKKAMQYLIDRCGEGSALPEQKSFWADWKDVGAMAGRRYGPHFSLLYLAALKEMSFVARELGENALADDWDARYLAAHEQVNRSVVDGGLWNGFFYANVWYDGHKDNALLEDQMVAAAWGVIPADRFESIRNMLNDLSERPWGVRETFPYYAAEQFGYEGGDYHNGAVWPWLSFADAIARCRYGHADDAARIMKAVGEWDLKAAGDHLPHENLHGETGQGIRHYIQGWNANYLGAVVWGLKGNWPGSKGEPWLR